MFDLRLFFFIMLVSSVQGAGQRKRQVSLLHKSLSGYIIADNLSTDLKPGSISAEFAYARQIYIEKGNKKDLCNIMTRIVREVSDIVAQDRLQQNYTQAFMWAGVLSRACKIAQFIGVDVDAGVLCKWKKAEEMLSVGVRYTENIYRARMFYKHRLSAPIILN